MFDLDGRVRQWRERQERTSSLSPRELDELEDHLRARVDLEMELNAVLAPERAFAIARHDLGEAAALEQEFAKAGKPRWRRWLVAGWAMFAASAVLPVANVFGTPYFGHEVFRDVLLNVRGEWPLTLINLAMVLTLPSLWGAGLSCSRLLRWILGTVGVCCIGMVAFGTSMILANGGLASLLPHGFLAAVWCWGGSYICVANALRMRARAWAPAKLKRVPAP